MFQTQQSSSRALMPSVSRVSSQDKRAKKTYYKLIAAALDWAYAHVLVYLVLPCFSDKFQA